MAYSREKLGGNQMDLQVVADFNQAMDHCALTDLEYRGTRFT